MVIADHLQTLHDLKRGTHSKKMLNLEFLFQTR